MDVPDPTAALAAVRDTIARAAARAGRDPDTVTLIAVTKTHDADAIRPLLEAGHRDFGENRVGEAAAKWPALQADCPDIRLHMIGQLQSNKAADAASLAHAIHTVDRPSLIEALGRATFAGPVFVQLNLEGAAQKGGCAPADLPAVLARARDAGLRVAGLMCVPPLGLEPAPWFALTQKLARDHGLDGLSMGMSGDYATAVTLGATHVRVGSALFGARG